MSEPVNRLGDTMPPEGSEKREALRKRVDALLRDLEEFGDQRLHPLVGRAFIDSNKGLLWCMDCGAMFEPDPEAGHGRAACPRCTSRACVPFVPKPLEQPARPPTD